MRLDLVQVNIVLLAQSHNPTIASKEWLLVHGVLSPPVTNFSHVPVFSMVETDKMLFTVDQSRLQVIAKQANEDALAIPKHAVERYVEALPETPYTAVGFNFHWEVLSEEEGEVSALSQRLFLGDRDRVVRCFGSAAGMHVGGIIYVPRDSFLLKLVVEPVLKEPAKLLMVFNYHAEVQGAREVLDALEEQRRCFDDARSTAGGLTEA